MKKIFFSLSQQVKNYSTIQELSLNNLFNKYLNNLSDKTRVTFQQECLDIFDKISLQDIQNNIREANEMMVNRVNRKPLKIIEIFAKTASLADGIVESHSGRKKPLTSETKIILAQAYASYADILYKLKPSESEKVENLVKKALELDPKNETAVLLRFNMHFYDIVPEPKLPTV